MDANKYKSNGAGNVGGACAHGMWTRVCVLVIAVGACLLLSGCETFRLWGEKGSGSPGTMGGSMSIPLGKK